MRSRLTTTAKVAGLFAAGSVLTGCGLFGESYDVRMEVEGSGSAVVTSKFAGGKSSTGERDLPWTESESVGFGFNDLWLVDAEPGAICRILVDDRVLDEQTADEDGNAECYVNNQDD
ncbi:hypothetical protein [Actinoalloteichus hymeniacidonis]|uniref:Lipoprotein n=1 Tax=Actinoalloteichus hymeniacidonis TaxID=340345 RepID=A0AAC9MWD8_9PSEU|nr:hypothetical protein [Actinoalloteichus hymeniacidonis]AOS62098.1 hypothetical protein TL08_06365 [Actinoalloteichus hymeniacidonis]MBB5909880.1 hypothetical protein [Actinoalloteichus hymeniacidonis]